MNSNFLENSTTCVFALIKWEEGPESREPFKPSSERELHSRPKSQGKEHLLHALPRYLKNLTKQQVEHPLEEVLA